MHSPQTVEAITVRIEQAMQRVVEAVNSLSAAHLLEPRLAGGRSVKDTLAHLMWWDQWLLITLPVVSGTTPTPITLPLADQIPSTNDWADEMNAKVYAYYQPRELSTIKAEFTATCERLLHRVSELSHEDLDDPNGMAAIIGQPVAPLIHGIYDHYEEHAHELEQLRA